MRRRLILALAAAAALVVVGAVVAFVLFTSREPSSGGIDTELTGITVVKPKPVPRPAKPKPKPKPQPVVTEKPCWPTFGGDPQRSLARPHIALGRPTKSVWARGLGSYIEYPPVYCDGMLYVNTFRGVTYAIAARTGKVIWKRGGDGTKPSSPAIAGDRLIVSAKEGSVTAFDRATGRELWQFRLEARVESSPVVIGHSVYFGASDGRVFALDVRSGRPIWAYRTGGLINSSASVWGNRLCITTYAGSILCLDRRNGRLLWDTYVKRDLLRYESFYASASTDGQRLFTIARSGKVVALRASNGDVLWTHNLSTLGYSTPAVAHGHVYVGDFNGVLHSYDAATGEETWQRHVGGRILGPAVVIGQLVFFSTLEQKTYAARVSDGKIVWQLGMGKYSPGIATARHYYFSLNGILVAFNGASTPPEPKPAAKKSAAKKTAVSVCVPPRTCAPGGRRPRP